MYVATDIPSDHSKGLITGEENTRWYYGHGLFTCKYTYVCHSLSTFHKSHKLQAYDKSSWLSKHTALKKKTSDLLTQQYDYTRLSIFLLPDFCFSGSVV